MEKNETPIKRKKGWIKFVRVIVYLISIIGVSVGISLIKVGRLSAAYTDGTYAVKIQNGEIIFWSFLIILYINIVWGILRWFLKGYHEKWRPARIVGKIIGGGLWRILLIVPLILFSFLIVSDWVIDLIDEKMESSELAMLGTSSEKIIDDYENGLISLDEYVINLTDALYNSNKLPEKYKGERIDNENRVFNIVEDNIDNLDSDTLEYFYNKITLANVSFDSDEEISSGGLFFATAYASDNAGTIVQKFNKARLTKNGHFVIFYNSKDISQKIDFIDGVLEDSVEKYYSIFGQKWSYSPIKFGGELKKERESDFKKFLSKNGLAENILDKAMPVYIYDTGESYIAQRVGVSADGVTKILTGLVDNPAESDDDFVGRTTYSFPYIIMQAGAVLNSSNVSINEVLAHELSHHYVDSFCRSNSPTGSTCADLDDFTSEAFAQYMASVIVDKQEKGDFLYGHHNNYINLATCHTVNEILGRWDGGECSIKDYYSTNLGYPMAAFFENYAEIVPDFNDVIFKIAASTDEKYWFINGTSDLMELLYNKAGPEKFERTLVQLAQRNLTNDYGKKESFYAKKIPPGQKLPCIDFCDGNYRLEPASSKYYYFSTNDDIEYISYKIGKTSTLSILGMNASGKWEILEERYENDVDTIKVVEYVDKYEVIVLVVTNYDIHLNDHFGLNVLSKQFVKMLEDLGDFAENLENVYSDSGDNCYEINTNSLFELPSTMFNSAISVVNLIDYHMEEEDFSEVVSDIEQEKNNVESSLSEVKEDLSSYKFTVCQVNLGNNRNFDDTKKVLQDSMTDSINLYNGEYDGDKFSVFIEWDILTRKAKAHSLVDSVDGLVLITVNIENK